MTHDLILSEHEVLRFRELVDDSDPDGCWPWLGTISVYGYGKFHARRDRDGKRRWPGLPAHRVAYVLQHGVIPEFTLDHLCHNAAIDCPSDPTCLHRRCVRPAHLEDVPTEINSARGNGGIRMSEKTACPQGHEYTEENTVWVNRTKGRDAGKTSRMCRVCWLARGRAASMKYEQGKRESSCRVQYVDCAAGHVWVRPSQRGRPPVLCVEHQEEMHIERPKRVSTVVDDYDPETMTPWRVVEL